MVFPLPIKLLLTLIQQASRIPARPHSPMEEVCHVDAQLVCDKQQVAELHLLTGFHALDRRPVDAGGVRQGLLGAVHVQPADAHAVARRPAGVDDPLGMFGWHPSNALPTMIISQQQF